MKTEPQSEKARKRISDSLKERHRKNPGFTEKNLVRHKVGDKLSEETKLRISESRKRHYLLDLPDCKCIAHKKTKKNQTDIEILLVRTVLAGFSEIRTQEKFGPYSVDAYLPKYHLAFEADGEYWHSLPGRMDYDKARDAYLMENFSLPVIRFTGSEIRAWR